MMFEPGIVDEQARWPLVRVTAGTDRLVVVRSVKPLWLSAHWAGRLVVCAGELCPLCQLTPVRQRAFFAASERGRLKILELPVRSALDLEQSAKLLSDGRLLGSTFMLRRRHKKSEIRSEYQSVDDSVAEVPMHTLANVVFPLFGLPHLQRGQTLPEYEEMHANLVRERAELHAARMRAASVDRP